MYAAVGGGAGEAEPTASSPRAAEPQFYYTLEFPATDSQSASLSALQHRIRFTDACDVVRAATPGGREREQRALAELRALWVARFRSPAPAPTDTLPLALLRELLRELVVQRLDALPGLAVRCRRRGDRLLVSVRPSPALLCATADRLKLPVPAARELDPAVGPRGQGDADKELDRGDVVEELARLFLAARIPAAEAQVLPGETPPTWTRRLQTLRRRGEPQSYQQQSLVEGGEDAVEDEDRAAVALASATFLPFSRRPALRYLFRPTVDGQQGDDGPFRAVDRIRLTKAVLDAELDCDALVARGVLRSHWAPHSRKGGEGTDSVDVTIDDLQQQWGSLLPSWRCRPTRCSARELWRLPARQPLGRVRDYFGEQLALYFAFGSAQVLALQRLAAFALLLTVASAASRWPPPPARHVAFFAAFALANAAALRVLERKWTLRAQVLAAAWGVAGADDAVADLRQAPRPQFRGELARSAVSLRLEPYFSPNKRELRRLMATAALAGVVSALVAAYVALAASSNYQTLATDSPALASAALALLARTAAPALAQAAATLTDWENHRSQRQHDASLALKLALAQTANAFGALWFLALGRPLLSPEVCGPDGGACRDQAAALLLASLALDLVLSLLRLMAGVARALMARTAAAAASWRSRDAEPADVDVETGLRRRRGSRRGRPPSPSRRRLLPSAAALVAVDDAELPPHDGALREYAALLLPLGLAAWFAALAPLPACALAWAASVARLRCAAHRLAFRAQRPFPSRSASFGGWSAVLRAWSLGGAAHNAALVALRCADSPTAIPLDQAALAAGAAFALLWWSLGLDDGRDRAARRALSAAAQRSAFLQARHLSGGQLDAAALAAADLPAGRVFLNGVFRFAVTGDQREQDAAEELMDQCRRLQRRVDDLEARVAAAQLASGSKPIGELLVEVVGAMALPPAAAYVELRLAGSDPPLPPANTAASAPSRAPQWRESFALPLAALDGAAALELRVLEAARVGKPRRLGAARLSVLDVVDRCAAAREPASPSRSPLKQPKPEPMQQQAEPAMASFELPLDVDDALLAALAPDLARTGHPRLAVRAGVQLAALGELFVAQRRAQLRLAELRRQEQRFLQWSGSS